MAIVELGPVTTRLVVVLNDTVDRLKPRNPHKIAFSVPDRLEVSVFANSEQPRAAVKPLAPTERADFDDLRRLRGALYDDRDS